MSAPADSDLRELERELLLAAEAAETRTFNDLRDRSGMGVDELTVALGTLREHGKAVEAAPGEWRGPSEDELPSEAADPLAGTGPVTVHTADVPEEEEEAERATSLHEFVGASSVMSEPTVRLTFGVADALDDNAIGQLVKAGIAEARTAGEPFILEVS